MSATLQPVSSSPGRGLYGSPGFMAPAFRAAWREGYGDIPGMIQAAHDEHQAGRLRNAWVAYTAALQLWIRRVWEEYSDTVDDQDRTPNSYAQSLYRAQVFDKWTVRVIEKMLERPNRIHWWHVEALAAFVSALTLESARGDQRGGAPC